MQQTSEYICIGQIISARIEENKKTGVSAESGKVKEIRAPANFCLHSRLKPRLVFFRLSGEPLYVRWAMKILCQIGPTADFNGAAIPPPTSAVGPIWIGRRLE